MKFGLTVQVGKPMPRWQGPRSEGPQFQLDRHGCLLMLYYHRPTLQEILAARAGGRADFAVVPVGPHTLFLLYRIQMLSDWSDAPYAFGLVAQQDRPLPTRSDTEGYPLTILLLDAAIGTVHAIREISLDPAFSATLERLVLDQQQALPAFTKVAHQAALSWAYRRWRKPRDMLSAAAARTRGGIAFPPH